MCVCVSADYLYLFTWHLKAERLIVVRIQSVLLYCCFLFLEFFPILD